MQRQAQWADAATRRRATALAPKLHRYQRENALAELKKHIGRVVHVHCKDVREKVMKESREKDMSFLNSVLAGVFTVPGDGMIDFEPILATLADHNYSGWLVVEAEQDPALAPSYEYAKKGFDCLSGLVRKING